MIHFVGLIILCALILWLIFASNKPSDNRWISKNEQNYIERSIDLQFNNKKINNLITYESEITNDHIDNNNKKMVNY